MIGIEWDKEIEERIYEILRDAGITSIRAFDIREQITESVEAHSVGRIVCQKDGCLEDKTSEWGKSTAEEKTDEMHS